MQYENHTPAALIKIIIKEKILMNFNIFKWRSLNTKMTIFTLAIFLVSIWSLAFYASRLLYQDMQRLSGDQ